MNKLENFGCVAALAGILACAPSCEEERTPRFEDHYKTFEFAVPNAKIHEMIQVRGKMRASIGCYVDTHKGVIKCSVPKGNAKWRNPSM